LKVNVLFYYENSVRYSINALVASIDIIEGVRVHLLKNWSELAETAKLIIDRNELCVAAFSLLTTMLVKHGYERIRSMVDTLKRLGCITIAGGPHPSGDPIGTLTSLGFDYVFIGEAEKTLRRFLESLINGEDPRRLRGIAFVDDHGRFVYGGREDPINLDDYEPFPHWRGIVNPVEITRGCPYGCFYCQVSYLHGFKYRHRSPENVARIIERVSKLGVKDYRFISPDSLAYGSTHASREVNIEALEDLLSRIHTIAMKHSGRIFLGSFPSEVRPEHVTRESLTVLKRYVSNRSLIIGAQSGSERVLKLIKRGHSVEDVISAVELAVQYGFTPHVDFIFGIPDETEEDMYNSLNLIKKLIEMGAKIHLHHFIPLPGSPLGLRKPSNIPPKIKKDLWKIVGAGKGYGYWVEQEMLAWKIVELHEKGVIMPRRSKAPGFITYSAWGSGSSQ
jgi:B12-binding domain/radical SAM domain protein